MSSPPSSPVRRRRTLTRATPTKPWYAELCGECAKAKVPPTALEVRPVSDKFVARCDFCDRRRVLQIRANAAFFGDLKDRAREPLVPYNPSRDLA